MAFANTYGGTIFVGVEDNGQIMGTVAEKFEERVVSQLRSNCEPMPEVTVEKQVVQEKPVYLVRIPEGEDKPYNYKDKGV